MTHREDLQDRLDKRADDQDALVDQRRGRGLQPLRGASRSSERYPAGKCEVCERPLWDAYPKVCLNCVKTPTIRHPDTDRSTK